MARLEWGTVGTRFYEAGVDRGVLYVGAQPGVAWTGLTSVETNPSGGEPKAYYIDGVKYSNVSSVEEFEATINAFTYPELFSECDGTLQIRSGLFLTQQRRKPFAFSYRTMVGNDVNGTDHGYKIHIVYNALASPAQKTHETISDRTEPSEFSWNVTTRPPAVVGYKRTAHIEIDSRTTDAVVLNAIEKALYGDSSTTPHLLSIAEIVAIFDAFYSLEVIDNGDGIFTINGPDEAIQLLGEDLIQIMWPTVVAVDANTYTITSD